jgi:hypothetical protein
MHVEKRIDREVRKKWKMYKNRGYNAYPYRIKIVSFPQAIHKSRDMRRRFSPNAIPVVARGPCAFACLEDKVPTRHVALVQADLLAASPRDRLRLAIDWP